MSSSEPALAEHLEDAAAQWWQDMLDSPHSFDKATFYIGLADRPGANIVADGAIERTKFRVYVLPMGLSGFSRPGDAAYYRVQVGDCDRVTWGRVVHEGGKGCSTQGLPQTQ